MTLLMHWQAECTDWIQTAKILLSQLTGESTEQMFLARTSMKTVAPDQETEIPVDTEHANDAANEGLGSEVGIV